MDTACGSTCRSAASGFHISCDASANGLRISRSRFAALPPSATDGQIRAPQPTCFDDATVPELNTHKWAAVLHPETRETQPALPSLLIVHRAEPARLLI